MMISKTFILSALMMAMSLVLVGCGGGGSGADSSPSNNDNTPKPVTCSKTQYLEDGSCKNKVVQTIQSLPFSTLIQGQTYPLSLKTNQDLPVNFTSNTPSICSVSGSEIKALKFGQCTLTLTQAGTTKILPFNSSMTVNVTCAADQYLENNSCVNKAKQTITPLKVKYILTDSVYSLETKSSTELPVTINSLSATTCTYSNGELKGVNAGTCTLQFTQDGNAKTQAAESKTISFDVFTASSMSATPDINNCYAGKLSTSFRNEFLNEINTIRTLHGLPSIQYDYAHEDEMMQTALILAVNNIMTHYPESNTTCYSDIGAVGAKTSSLEMGVTWSMYNYFPSDSVKNWLNDKTNVVNNSVGHRRWILDPFLQKSAYGLVNAPSIKNTQFPYVVATSHKTVYPTRNATTAALGIIAYPYHDYPAKYFANGVPLSISILIDQNSSWANQNVDYSKAELVVIQRGGTIQNISNISYDNIATGIPNNIQFNFDDLKNNVIYDVKLSNVLVNGTAKDYSYWFKVSDK